VLLGRPAAPIGADLGEQAQPAIAPQTIDPGQVHAGEPVQRRANLEPRLVQARLASRARQRHRGEWSGGLGSELLPVRFDFDIAGCDLALVGVEQGAPSVVLPDLASETR